ncbi:hypothetical protein ESCO_005856 [Escovopsis weberi]|uniref:Uncharacterized protein n=1 Tax=Escovopsis weberi TaxID=150374 RepID=A0A0M8MUG2_ESCWE|nr:hypothetical protein ESCO_005856 [Escovopsis weberi]
MAQQVQRERHWLWSAEAEDGYGFERAFSEAKFWACGVYARACDRLRTAAAGHNAASIHNPPFYGCFIGKLQQRVRLFYGIDGCDWDDFWDACCCPCLTLVRSEQEIILRERLANDPNGCNKAYQRSGPMVSTYTGRAHWPRRQQ